MSFDAHFRRKNLDFSYELFLRHKYKWQMKVVICFPCVGVGYTKGENIDMWAEWCYTATVAMGTRGFGTWWYHGNRRYYGDPAWCRSRCTHQMIFSFFHLRSWLVVFIKRIEQICGLRKGKAVCMRLRHQQKNTHCEWQQLSAEWAS